ncbi:hypothetical protein BC938DRAFT_483872, partial [Jimgerdemannia flammicorona]
DRYLNIQIESVKNYENALNYIRQLGPHEADKNLQKYGKTLLAHLPNETTQLLIDLCTGSLTLASTPATGRPGTPQPQPSGSGLQSLATRPYTSSAMESIVVSSSQQVSARPVAGSTRHNSQPGQSQKPGKDGKYKGYAPPAPKQFMSLFVDRPDCLIKFLEQVFERRWGDESPSATASSAVSARGSVDAASTRSDTLKPPSEITKTRTNLSYNTINTLDQGTFFVGSITVDNDVNFGSKDEPGIEPDLEERKSIWNTLLELYLLDEKPLNSFSSSTPLSPVLSSSAASGVGSERELGKRRKEFRTKALNLLKDPSVPYDTNQALVLCHLKTFDDGIVYLYERMEMYRDIVRFWMEKDETDRVIEAVANPRDTTIYPLVLTYFSSTPETLSKSTFELLQVLQRIESADLLPPLQVVQALSRNSVATVGLLKGYMAKKIENERKEVEEDRQLIQSYRDETEKKRREIEELKSKFVAIFDHSTITS